MTDLTESHDVVTIRKRTIVRVWLSVTPAIERDQQGWRADDRADAGCCGERP
jgi:hypothetical protein